MRVLSVYQQTLKKNDGRTLLIFFEKKVIIFLLVIVEFYIALVLRSCDGTQPNWLAK